MLWLIPLLPLVAAPALYAAGRRWPGSWVTAAAAVLIAGTLVLACLAVWQDWQAGYPWSALIALHLELSVAGAVYGLAVPLVALPVIAHAGLHPPPSGLDGARGPARLLALLVAFVGAMLLLVLAADLLTLLIAWELVGACSWALIAQEWWEPGTAEDAGWAFLVTRSGDLGLYAAAAVLYAGTGSFAYTAIPSLDGWLLQVFAAGVLLAAAAKSAQLPFAPWLFAAMSGPVPVSALLHAATMVAAGVFLLVRLHAELGAVPWVAPVALGVGLTTALAAGLVASVQGHAKKLLAASTSAQYGLMWIAVGAGYPGVALLHFLAHACMKAPLFLAVGTRAGKGHRYALDELARAPAVLGLATSALVASLALAGVAPLGAAWTKDAVVAAAGHQALWLALLVVLAGGLSALYATRLQLIVFGLPARPRGGAWRPPAEVWPIIALATLTLALSVLWWPGVRQALEAMLGLALPATTMGELMLSLALVALGVAAGAGLAWRAPRLAQRPILIRTAAWLGLPALGRAVLLRPLQAATHALARFDDWVLGVVTSAQLRLPSVGLARFDDRVVDRGVRATARFGAWLAALGARTGEAIFDGLPGGAARGARESGRMIRALHTGLVHQYYVLVAAGLAALALMLGIGGLF